MHHRDLVPASLLLDRSTPVGLLPALALFTILLMGGVAGSARAEEPPATEAGPGTTESSESAPAAGDEALFTAAAAGDLPGVVARLDAGAAVNGGDAEGRTALMVATAANRPSMVEFLLSHGADLEAQDNAGNTALFLAPTAGPRMVRRLLDHEASATTTNTAGHSPLVSAVQAGDVESVDALLEAGAPVDTSGEIEGHGVVTPLLLAVDGGHGEIIRRLVAKGADANLRDAEGRTALERAKDVGHTELVELLARAARNKLP